MKPAASRQSPEPADDAGGKAVPDGEQPQPGVSPEDDYEPV